MGAFLVVLVLLLVYIIGVFKGTQENFKYGGIRGLDLGSDNEKCFCTIIYSKLLSFIPNDVTQTDPLERTHDIEGIK